jgi:hypothetical protein
MRKRNKRGKDLLTNNLRPTEMGTKKRIRPFDISKGIEAHIELDERNKIK